MNCVHEYLSSSKSSSLNDAIIFYRGNKSLDNSKLRCSFHSLTEIAKKSVNYLKRKGFSKGDKIILFEKPTPGLYGFIIGALSQGIKIMIIEPWMSGENFNFIIDQHNPKGILCSLAGRGFLLKSRRVKNIPIRMTIKEMMTAPVGKIDVVDVRPSDEAILTFTSGSSGRPKGVHRKHGYLIDQRAVLKKYLDYENLNYLDLTVFTNMVLLNLILGKGSLVIDGSWSPKIIRDLDDLPNDLKLDTIATGPKFLELLLDNTSKLNLRSFHIGGALGDVDLYERAINRWPKAEFVHVYGSTEAEPVSFCDLRESVIKSKKNKFTQTLFLGKPVDEIELLQREGTLWVSGSHVSPLYENDPVANQKNKWTDDNGVLWHNMGDKVSHNEDGLWYGGREFQFLKEFELEQRVYSLTTQTSSFIKNEDGTYHLYGELSDEDVKRVLSAVPEISMFTYLKIVRDPRHRSRIDRTKSLSKGLYMNNIIEFIKERVPLIANLILAVGMILSVAATAGVAPDLGKSLFVGITLLVFITELRFMDELKDFEKDKIAHPDRPLPRGLVSKDQVNLLINLFFGLLLACVALSYLFFNPLAGHYLLVTVIWLFLMYNEFFAGNMLAKSPMAYAVTHQVIIIPVCLFVFNVFDYPMLNSSTVGFCLLVLSSFFTFEVGRKMDPASNPILGTYLVQYGKFRTNILLILLAGIGVYGTMLLDKLWWWGMAPFLLMVATQIRIWFQTSRFKDLEGMIALNLIFNMWLMAIAGWFS